LGEKLKKRGMLFKGANEIQGAVNSDPMHSWRQGLGEHCQQPNWGLEPNVVLVHTKASEIA